MRVLLAGGGTAGHINPALAIAAELKAQDPTTEFLFVGADDRMETELVPKAGYPFTSITVRGFSRKKTLKAVFHNLGTVYYAVTAGFTCGSILKKFKPDVVVGTGGYVCGPMLRKAAKKGYPVVIHESNSYPGVTVKALARMVNTVCIPNEEAAGRLPAGTHTVVTGNPLRPEVLHTDKAQARKELGIDNRPLVLSVGGSLGAAKINELVIHLLEASHKEGRYQHIHSTGKGEYEEVCEALSEKQIPLHADGIDVRPYIDDLPRCMAAADLVICRCGAITTSEVLAIGTPAILIPSPNVAENHQYYNALALVNQGAAVCIEEKDITDELLWKTVSELLDDPERLSQMHDNAVHAAITDATERIVKIVKDAAKS